MSYQQRYGRTDRPLPNARPVSGSTVEQCNAYHTQYCENALQRSLNADPENPSPYIWLETQYIVGLDEIPSSFSFTTQSVKIMREDIDTGIVRCGETEIPVSWDYAQGIWVRD